MIKTLDNYNKSIDEILKYFGIECYRDYHIKDMTGANWSKSEREFEYWPSFFPFVKPELLRDNFKTRRSLTIDSKKGCYRKKDYTALISGCIYYFNKDKEVGEKFIFIFDNKKKKKWKELNETTR